MRHAAILLTALFVVACRTHTVDFCASDCDPADVDEFIACVANGRDECAAGNRRCCAVTQGCLGALEDQTVVSSRPVCVEELACFPACMSMDRILYEGCVSTGAASGCAAGDERCCALQANCLGAVDELGEVYVYADGCCAPDRPCPNDETCDLLRGQCIPTSGDCGNGTVEGEEECEPDPEVLECEYGLESCMICSDLCTLVEGDTSFCGDGLVDTDFDEECDPPDATCDDACHDALPAHCFNTAVDGTETDINCGGDCDPCHGDQRCRDDDDCAVEFPECGGTIFCEVAMGLCFETSGCDDSDPCTEDLCEEGVGCTNPDLDRDMDGEMPNDPPALCGPDCNDFDPLINTRAVEVGCFTSDPGFGVDENCNGAMEEGC